MSNPDDSNNLSRQKAKLEKQHLISFLNLNGENRKLLREREGLNRNSQNGENQSRISEINRILEINKNIKESIDKGFINSKKDIYRTLQIKENSEWFQSQDEGYKEQSQGLSWLELGLHDRMTPKQIESTIIIGAYKTYCEENNLEIPQLAEINRQIVEAQNLNTLL